MKILTIIKDEERVVTEVEGLVTPISLLLIKINGAEDYIEKLKTAVAVAQKDQTIKEECQAKFDAIKELVGEEIGG